MKTALKNYWLWLGGLLFTVNAFAEEGTHAAAASALNWSTPLAIGLGIALAVIAAATAQGRIASAYMEGVSRNPGAQKAMGTQLILSLVFVETLVLFTFAIVYLLMGKI